MSVPSEPVWEIEPHTKAKHEILQRYLGAWFGIMGQTNKRIIYLDGFCGPGRYKGGEPGSPIIALKIALEQHKKGRITEATFIFIEEKLDRVNHLKNEVKRMILPDDFHVHIEQNQFESTLKEILDSLDDQDAKIAPTFAFIDPFGFKGASYQLIERLLKNSKTEVFITFMIDSINRFLDHPNENVVAHIIDLFGTEKIKEPLADCGDRREKLIKIYFSQLESIAKYVRYFQMLDESNRLIYCLFFATNHRLGLRKMKEAFWKVDKTSGLKFSDKTDPNQLVLFQEDYSNDLAELIYEKFSGQKLEVKRIRYFVEDFTPFLSSHMRRALKILENDNRVFIESIKANGKTRRKGTFPDEVIIQF